MKVIEVSSAKGGVGTTTVACSLALALAKKSPERVLLLDLSKYNDCTAMLATSTNPDKVNYANGMTIKGITRKQIKDALSVEGNYDFVIIDAGTETVEQLPLDLRVQVTRNEYMAIRAETISGRTGFGACVVLFNEDHAINVNDVQMVLRNIPTVFKISSNVARTIDAGLFASTDKHWKEWTDSIIETHFSEVLN